MARYSKEFKAEALRLSDEIGVKKAASQLGLPYYTLADWRNDRKNKEPEPEIERCLAEDPKPRAGAGKRRAATCQ